MKFLGRDKDKDNEEKPIIFYYAKYIGVLGSDKSRPVDEDSYVYIFNDRIEIKLLKSKGGILLTSKGEWTQTEFYYLVFRVFYGKDMR